MESVRAFLREAAYRFLLYLPLVFMAALALGATVTALIAPGTVTVSQPRTGYLPPCLRLK